MTLSMTLTLRLVLLLLTFHQLLYSAVGDYFERFKSYNNITASDYQRFKGDMVQYREGDVIIGVLARVHNRGESSSCNKVLEDGIQEIETVNMIVDMFNQDPSILPNVTIGTVMIDTCDIDTHAVERIIRVILPFFFGNRGEDENIPLFAGIVGASSSGVSLQTASLLQVFKIPQVSPWSTHPDLSNKDRFPYFFRAVPPDTFQAAAIVNLLVKQGWDYVSVVYEDDFYGLQGFREVEIEATKFGICLASTIPIPRNPQAKFFEDAVEQLLDASNARVVILFAKRVDAEKLIRAANRNSESRKYFTWLGSDGWIDQLPTGDNESDYLESLNGSLGFTPKNSIITSLGQYLTNQTNQFRWCTNPWSTSNKNPWLPEFLSKKTKCNIEGINTSRNETKNPIKKVLAKMQKVADAVYAIVHSLDQHVRTVCGEGICLNISRTAGTNQLAQNVYRRMINISFRGIAGNKFKFDIFQDGPAEFYLLQFSSNSSSKKTQFNDWVRRGQFKNGESSWKDNESTVDDILSRCSEPCKEGEAQVAESSKCCWICQRCQDFQYVKNDTMCVDCPDGHVPSNDRKTCTKADLYISGFSDPYGIASTVIAGFGLAINAFVSLTFYTNRNTAIVKATGKESCWFILIGATLCFLNSFVLHSYPTTALCCFSRVFLAVGPTSMYAAIITKTIRIIVIFHSKDILSRQVKTFLLPKYQVLTTFLFLLLQLCIVGFWFATSPPYITTIYPDRQSAFLACSDVEGLFVLIGYAYPFLLIIACTVLATLNRKVPTGFNETQYIGFTMYATCVIWLAFIPVFISNPNNISLKIATLAICLSLSAITVLGCLFGHRCYTIICKPNENNPKSVMSSVNMKDGTSHITNKSEIIRRENEQHKAGECKGGPAIWGKKKVSCATVSVTVA